MKSLKSFGLGLTLVAVLGANSVYAKNDSMSTNELGTLATIAAIDKNEILAGVVASNKKASSSVTDFAKMMIDQHGSNLTQILEMASSVKGSTLKGGQADKLTAEGNKLLAQLGGLNGDAFDHAYVDAMVKGHEDALNLIDQKLLKTAKTEDVKKFLTDTRAAVETHLEDAKKLQDKIKA